MTVQRIEARRDVRRARARRLFTLAAAAVGAVQPLLSGIQTARGDLAFDPGGTPGGTPAAPTGSGGSGVWDTATPIWSNSALPDVPFDGTTAIFAGATGGTVTLTGAVSAAGVTFDPTADAGATTYTVTTGAAGVLTLTGAGLITANQNAAINAPIAGAVGLTKAGAATLSLGGTNTFTGTVTVNAGNLSVSSVAGLGAAAGAVTLGTASATAGLIYTGATSASVARTITLGAGGTTTAGNVVSVTNAAATLTLNGVISGGPVTTTSLALVIPSTSLGIVQLATATGGAITNTFTGSILVDGGRLQVVGSNGAGGDPLAAGAGNKTITLQNGGTFISAGTLINPTSTGGVKTFIIGTGGGTFQTNVNLTIDDNGQFGGTGDLIKTGTAQLNLGADYASGGTFGNVFSGQITITAGTLLLNRNANALGTTTGRTIIQSGASLNAGFTGSPEPLTLNGTGASTAIGAVGNSLTTGVVALLGPVQLAGNTTVGGTGPLTFSGAISLDPSTTSAALTINATAAVTLSGANSYNGGTTVNSGTVAVGAASTLGTNVATNAITVSPIGIVTLAAATNVGNLQPITLQSNTTSMSVLGVGFATPPGSSITTSFSGGATFGGVYALNATSNADLSTLVAQGLLIGSTTNGTYSGTTLSTQTGNIYRLGGGGGSLTVTTLLSGPTGTSVVVGDTRTNGFGTVVLGNAANTFDGTVTALNGTVSVATLPNAGSASGPLGSGSSAIILGSATTPGGLTYTGANATSNRGITINAGGGVVTVSTTATTLALSGTIATGGNAFNKLGTGTLSLTNTATPYAFGSLGVGLNAGTSGTLSFGAGTSVSATGAAAIIAVGSVTNSTSNSAIGTLDLSAATSFTANVSRVLVAGDAGGANGNIGNGGTLTSVVRLAPVNDITATFNSTTGPSILVAGSSGSAATNNLFTLGNVSTALTAPAVTFGGQKGNATVAFAAGGTGPTLTINNGGTGTGTTGRSVLRVGANGTAFLALSTGAVPIVNANFTGGSFGTAAAPSRLSQLVVGERIGGPSATTASTFGGVTSTMTLGTAANNVDINASAGTAPALYIGHLDLNGFTSVGVNLTGAATVGTFTVGGGTVGVVGNASAAAVILGNYSGTNGGNATSVVALAGNTVTGTLAVSGGVVTVTPGAGQAAVSLAPVGAGILNPSSNNTATGILTVNGGALTLNGRIDAGPGSTGAATVTTTINVSGGTLDMTGNNIAGVTNFNFTGGTITNLGTLSRAAGLTQNGLGSVLNVPTGISSTISGPYTLTAGTVKGNGTLTAAGGVAIGGGGIVAPGASIGTLSIASPVTFSGAAPTYTPEVQPSAAGQKADLLALTGGGTTNGLLNLSGATDVLNVLPLEAISGASASGPYPIATYGAINGAFDSILVNGQATQSGDPTAPNYVLVTYTGGAGAAGEADLSINNVSAVPEPASVGLLGIGALGLLGRRRRRRAATPMA